MTDRFIGQYANGTKLIIRTGLRFGTCPVRFEGDEGWVETGDSGGLEVYPRSLLGNRGFEGGYPAGNHVRAFLDCVKTRKPANANSDVAARSHVACHAAYIAWQLGRTLQFDPATEAFLADDEANRMRSRAMRDPWRI